MPIVISEIVTETAVTPNAATGQQAAQPGQVDLDLVVRRAVERVLEVLRREWDR